MALAGVIKAMLFLSLCLLSASSYPGHVCMVMEDTQEKSECTSHWKYKKAANIPLARAVDTTELKARGREVPFVYHERKAKSAIV